MKNNYKNLVVGDNKNLTGMIYLLGTLMGFFYHTKKADIDEYHTILLLLFITILAMFLSRI